MLYNVTDGHADIEIEASSAEEAAQEYVAGGDWNSEHTTVWVTVYVTLQGGEDGDEAEVHTIEVSPAEPPCPKGTHHWESPHDQVGGLKSNPGVFGHGGGVVFTEVCGCGCTKTTDTWAQNPCTGEQGLTSVTYGRQDSLAY